MHRRGSAPLGTYLRRGRGEELADNEHSDDKCDIELKGDASMCHDDSVHLVWEDGEELLALQVATTAECKPFMV